MTASVLAIPQRSPDSTAAEVNPLFPQRSLSNSERQWIDRLRNDIDLRVATIRPFLFRLADAVNELHSQKPFTGILIDDTSARFIGRFIHATLPATPALPVRFHKLSHDLKYSWARSQAEAKNLREDWKSLGERPLFVTELIGEGTTAIVTCRIFRSLGVHPVIAALADEGHYFNILKSIRLAGAEQTLCADRWRTVSTKVCKSPALNGVVETRDGIVRWPSINYRQGELSPFVRQMAVNHSRERLHELVASYQDPGQAHDKPTVRDLVAEYFRAKWKTSPRPYDPTPFDDPTEFVR